ncbi:MAG: hypothetical protein J6B47_01330 [Prevotella sp.]|nr:hypothetical protein [Prevotella sp.]
MKTNITHFFYMAALVLLTACSQDDETSTATPPQNNGKPLTFTITDGGFSTGGNSGTRAVEEDNKTNFTAGDACGLYIVRNGKVRSANVKLTATQSGESIVWTTMNEEVTGETTDSYYMYYPYQEDMTDKVSVTDGADDKAFFENLISGWEVKADQSEYANYTASDLMTAQGVPTESDGTIALTFSTVHRMALAVIEMPKITYHFTNTSPEISDYIIPNPETVTVTFSETTKPWQVEEGIYIYRYIINPDKASAITGNYTSDATTKKVTRNFTILSEKLKAVTAGKGKKFKIDGGIREISHNLQVGDYLCKDGTLISKETTLTDDQKKTVVAIVFYAGHNDNDETDYEPTEIRQKKCHGYAVALKNADNKGFNTFIWGKTGEIGCYVNDNYSKPENDWNGYKYFFKFLQAASNGLEKDYPAAYNATNYNNTVSSPITCTCWFLPSIGQLKTICVNRKEIFKNLGSNNWSSVLYWSSSECYNSPTNEALLYYGSGDDNNASYMTTDLKNSKNYKVRSILAF